MGGVRATHARAAAVAAAPRAALRPALAARRAPAGGRTAALPATSSHCSADASRRTGAVDASEGAATVAVEAAFRAGSMPAVVSADSEPGPFSMAANAQA